MCQLTENNIILIMPGELWITVLHGKSANGLTTAVLESTGNIGCLQFICWKQHAPVTELEVCSYVCFPKICIPLFKLSKCSLLILFAAVGKFGNTKHCLMHKMKLCLYQNNKSSSVSIPLQQTNSTVWPPAIPLYDSAWFKS